MWGGYIAFQYQYVVPTHQSPRKQVFICSIVFIVGSVLPLWCSHMVCVLQQIETKQADHYLNTPSVPPAGVLSLHCFEITHINQLWGTAERLKRLRLDVNFILIALKTCN